LENHGDSIFLGRQHGSPKHWYPTTSLHSVTTQKSNSADVVGYEM